MVRETSDTVSVTGHWRILSYVLPSVSEYNGIHWSKGSRRPLVTISFFAKLTPAIYHLFLSLPLTLSLSLSLSLYLSISLSLWWRALRFICSAHNGGVKEGVEQFIFAHCSHCSPPLPSLRHSFSPLPRTPLPILHPGPLAHLPNPFNHIHILAFSISPYIFINFPDLHAPYF